MATTAAPPVEEPARLQPEAPAASYPLLTGTSFAAIGAVMAWFAVQLAQFVGEAPDFDAMISLRESIVFHRDGLKGLIADRVGTGVHPPLMDTLTSISFAVFGEDPRSQQLIGVRAVRRAGRGRRTAAGAVSERDLPRAGGARRGDDALAGDRAVHGLARGRSCSSC